MPVLGIDIGTQSLKALVLDDNLHVLGSGGVAYAPSFPGPGCAEQDARVWLGALEPAIRAAMDQAALAGGDIGGIGVCGQLDGAVGVDRHCEPVAPALIWMDRRAAREAMLASRDLVRDRCGLVRDATHMAAKIAWLRRNLPNPDQVAFWHQPVSFVVARLTGRAFMSRSLASTTMLYDVEAGDWNADLLDAYGVEPSRLPELDDEIAIAGRLSAEGAALCGLPAGIPVAVGTGDDFSNLIGLGVAEPGPVAVSLGTAETVGALSERPVRDPDLLVETHAFPGGFFHLGNPGWLSGGAVRWASGILSCASDAEFSALAANAPPGCDGLTFIPALSGAMAPKWIETARGSFIGLSTSHDRAHMARAVLEGTAFAMRDIIDRLDALGVPTTRLRIAGGGARSRLWCQIRADVAGRPAETLTSSDASAVGAAMLASVAAGRFADLRSAGGALSHFMTKVLPDPENAEIYGQAYALYRERFAALEPTWPMPEESR